jgi:hypothetical protein
MLATKAMLKRLRMRLMILCEHSQSNYGTVAAMRGALVHYIFSMYEYHVMKPDF